MKQIRKVYPVCVACILLFLYLSTSSSVSSADEQAVELTITEGHFPRKIWQTWKVDPLEFEERDLTVARTWVSKNPGHRYEVLTDQNDMYYVETNFGPLGLNRPDIVFVYRTLTAKIIKADLLRYLVLYMEGGIYTDIDVEALRPIDRFVPTRYAEKDIDMVIGVEIDEPDWVDHPILGSKSRSFCQWTFMAKARQPVMMRLIDGILAWLHNLSKKQGVPISDLTLDFDEVISGTGPSAFTEAVLAEMSEKAGKPITWDTFHDMTESKLVGGFLVLTVEAFAAGQGHSDSGNHDARAALVKHHYHASKWPTNHPRFNHPMFGEVEDCNWNDECIHAWDENVKNFDNLPKDEQIRQIAMKQAREDAYREIVEKEKAEAAAKEEAARKEEEAVREKERPKDDGPGDEKPKAKDAKPKEERPKEDAPPEDRPNEDKKAPPPPENAPPKDAPPPRP
jgi:mannosyltransferase OCH1-like enzyme